MEIKFKYVAPDTLKLDKIEITTLPRITITNPIIDSPNNVTKMHDYLVDLFVRISTTAIVMRISAEASQGLIIDVLFIIKLSIFKILVITAYGKESVITSRTLVWLIAKLLLENPYDYQCVSQNSHLLSVNKVFRSKGGDIRRDTHWHLLYEFLSFKDKTY